MFGVLSVREPLIDTNFFHPISSTVDGQGEGISSSISLLHLGWHAIQPNGHTQDRKTCKNSRARNEMVQSS